MAKHLTSQRHIFKISSSRLARAKYNIKSLGIDDARRNGELIDLADSQMLRFVDMINGVEDQEQHVRELKLKIDTLKRKQIVTVQDMIKIRNFMNEVDEILFREDYMFVVIDKVSHYKKMYKKGFKINGITYRRLLGTTSGVKNSTIIFVNEKILPQLKEKIANGRNPEKKFTPAKLEAYQALACSASTPVSLPKGIVVVSDCFTQFRETVIHLDDTPEGCTKPIMTEKEDFLIELDESDGYGIGMPSLMARWSKDLQLHYTISGAVIRNSFCKGVVANVDFHEFARKHGVSEVVDVWGNVHNIFDIELVLTESMLKLWSSYDSIEDYLSNCEKHGYTFAITKPCVEYLEGERTMNYQFLQGYDFTDEEIDELIKPTVDEIKDILLGDLNKTVLYMNGVGMTEKNMRDYKCDFSTALMIEPEMKNDPFVRSSIKNMIKKRINDAKIGILNVEGNYSIVTGDPYALCQHMFGLEVTGLLKKYEVYNKYWVDKGVKQVAGFRAPMSTIENVRLLNINSSDECKEFYKYLTSITVLNCWDSLAQAMNGLDKDGDAIISVSTDVVVRNTINRKTILCEQRSASKCIPTEDDFFNSNIISFGNGVGSTTNRITAMREIQANFAPGSAEYEELGYRIRCGQLYQQNEIDKTKGIEVKPMPLEWYDKAANKPEEDDTPERLSEKEFNLRIVADKKPYFMRYVYPGVDNEYKKYIKSVNDKCVMLYRCSLDSLLEIEDKTDEQIEFINYYKERMPVGTAPCTINKICWKIEEEFDKFFETYNTSNVDFDYTILKKGVPYTNEIKEKIQKIYKEYSDCYSRYIVRCKNERVSSLEKNSTRSAMKSLFMKMCYDVCPNAHMLTDILLDICYKSNNSKQFVWDVCGDIIISNLLERNGNKLTFPTESEDGDISYKGKKFKLTTIEL